MATAEELLRVATDPILTIDVMSRKITIPKTISLLGVESDESVQKLKFSMPRHYNNIDLSEYDIRINYENANKEGDVSPAADVTVTSDTITFTWIVGRFAVMYEGEVTFVVCLRKIDGDGEIVNEFNTTRTTLPVAKGLETDESAVTDANPDVITAIAVETLEQAKENGDFTPVKGVDYYTEEERDEFADLIIRDHNGAFANALKGTVSGEVIRVDDVSPIEHTVNAKVRSKNLWPSIKSGSQATLAGVTLTRNTDGSISLNGTATTSTNFKVGEMYLPDGRYYLCDFAVGEFPDNTFARCQIYSYDTLESLSVHNYRESNFVAGTDTVLSAGMYECRICIAEGVVYNATLYPTLFAEKYGQPAEYVEYVDPSGVNVTACGKNLLAYPDKTNNITNTDGMNLNASMSNGLMKLSGTFNGGTPKAKVIYPDLVLRNTNYYTNAVILENLSVKLAPGTYIFSANDAMSTGVASVSGSYILIGELNGSVSAGKATAYKTGDVITVTNDECYAMFVLYVYSDSALTNFTYTASPQLEVGDAVTEFMPYIAGENAVPAADGSVDIPSVGPTMTLLTNTAGVTIEAEYSKDINRVEFGGGSGDVDLSEYAKTKYVDSNFVKKPTDTTYGNSLMTYNVATSGEQGTIGLVKYAQTATEWTIPYRNGAGSISTGTPTDEVHATTKKYVDDLMASKEWRLIRDDTLTEAAGEYKVTADADGNAIALKKMMIEVYADTTEGVYPSTGNLIFSLCQGNHDQNWAKTLWSTAPFPTTEGKCLYVRFDAEVIGTNAFTTVSTQKNVDGFGYTQLGAAAGVSRSQAFPLNRDNIGMFRLNYVGSGGMHVGTRIVVWGVDA